MISLQIDCPGVNPYLSFFGYEKLTEQLGKEETIEFFKEEINDLKTKSNK